MTENDLITRWREQTERLALLFAGEPDEKVEAALAAFAERIEAAWADAFPSARAENFAEIASAVVEEVRAGRREIVAARGGFAAQPAAGAA